MVLTGAINGEYDCIARIYYDDTIREWLITAAGASASGAPITCDFRVDQNISGSNGEWQANNSPTANRGSFSVTTTDVSLAATIYSRTYYRGLGTITAHLVETHAAGTSVDLNITFVATPNP